MPETSKPSTCPACAHEFTAQLVSTPRPGAARVYERLCGVCDRLHRALALREEELRLIAEAKALAADRHNAARNLTPPHASRRIVGQRKDFAP